MVAIGISLCIPKMISLTSFQKASAAEVDLEVTNLHLLKKDSRPTKPFCLLIHYLLFDLK